MDDVEEAVDVKTGKSFILNYWKITINMNELYNDIKVFQLNLLFQKDRLRLSLQANPWLVRRWTLPKTNKVLNKDVWFIFLSCANNKAASLEKEVPPLTIASYQMMDSNVYNNQMLLLLFLKE